MPAIAPPRIYKQGDAPDQNSLLDLIPWTDDLWVDTVLHLLKRCTAVNPYTWASTEGGGAVINFQDAEVPAGLVNGVNTVFTLVFAPSPALSLQLYRNGLIQKGGGVDYTLSAATVTMAAAPLTGDILLAWYRR